MERNSLTAQQLIDLVHESTPLTTENYPALLTLSGDIKENFIVGHSLRHLSKSIGKMHGLVETAEHGGRLDQEELKKNIFAFGFSLCKLCAVLGITGNELVDGVYQMAKDEKIDELFRHANKNENELQ